MKKIMICLLVCLLQLSIVHSQTERASKGHQWTGTTEQKIWGLMTIWAQTKFAFTPLFTVFSSTIDLGDK